MLPVLTAPSARYRALRELLTVHAFTSAGVTTRLEVPDVFAIRLGERRVPGPDQPDALDLLIRLFIEGGETSADQLAELLGAESPAVLRTLGLVHGDATLRSTVLLYPVDDLWLASDRADGQARQADAVYPALTASVRVFLAAMPEVTGRRVLELCAGTGVAALLAARRGARDVVAVDITARATHFAAFNALLNDLPLSARQGDLYAPVAGEQFDVILAHPPYVPSLHTRAIYRDGGADGEQITRAVIAGAPAHLAGEGLLLCTSSLTDRRSGSALDRVHGELGDEAARSDLLLLHVADLVPDSAFVSQLLRAVPEELPDVVESWRAYRGLDVTTLRLFTTVLRRHAGTRPSVLAGVSCDPGTAWPVVAWLLASHQLPRVMAEQPARWIGARPRLNRSARFQQRYAFFPEGDEPFLPESGLLSISTPIRMELAMSGNDAALLGALDGSRALEAIWCEYREAGAIPAEVTVEGFVASLLPLLTTGVLETDLLPLPAMSPT